MFQYKSSKNPFGFIFSLIILSFILYGLFTVASWLLQILWSLGPFLIIAAFFINKNVVLGYGKWLLQLLKERTLFGIAMIILSVVAFPILSIYLFGRSLLANKMKNVMKEMENSGFGGTKNTKFSEYEELESNPTKKDNCILDLDKIARKANIDVSPESNNNESSDYL